MELRKSVPKIPVPFKCYIYQTKKNWLYKVLPRFRSFNWAQCIMNGQAKVVGEFTCDYIMRFCHMANADMAERQSCVRREDIFEYSCGKEVYGWHITDLAIYDKPIALSEFTGLRHTKFGYEPVRIKRAPQSWCYVEES